MYYDGVELSDAFDPNNPSFYYDSDDFDTLEEYYDYCDRHGITPPPQMAPVRGTTSSNIVKATAVIEFELKHNNAIQSFAYDSNDIYISQAYVNLTFNGTKYPQDPDNPDNLVLITKCKKKPGNSKVYVPDSYMLLKGVGHGQTLEVYTYNKKKYLLVSCGGQRAPENSRDRWWSTELGRIEYTPNAVVESKQIKRTVRLEYSAPDVNEFGSLLKRVDGAVSDDSKTLLIWASSGSKKYKTFAGYDFETINTLWDSTDVINLSSNATFQNARKFSFAQNFNTQASMQGLDVSKYNKKCTIFNSSGNEHSGKSNILYMFESVNPDKTLKEAEIDDTGVWALVDKDNKNLNVEAEIEGVKLKGNYLHFVLRDAEGAIDNKQVIAKVGKSKLKKLTD